MWGKKNACNLLPDEENSSLIVFHRKLTSNILFTYETYWFLTYLIVFFIFGSWLVGEKFFSERTPPREISTKTEKLPPGELHS